MARVGFIQNDLDLKLLVLYIMNRAAAPITFLHLLDLALCDAGVDYFSLTNAVDHLVETGHLTLSGQLYAITDKGRRNCRICESSLPFSVRRRCDENLAVLNARLLRDAQVRGELSPRQDGTYTVSLSLDDDAGSLLKLDLFAPTREQAEHLIAQFKLRPEQVYNGVINALLSVPEQGDAPGGTEQ